LSTPTRWPARALALSNLVPHLNFKDQLCRVLR
jgi:hypothetical protein